MLVLFFLNFTLRYWENYVAWIPEPVLLSIFLVVVPGMAVVTAILSKKENELLLYRALILVLVGLNYLFWLAYFAVV